MIKLSNWFEYHIKLSFLLKSHYLIITSNMSSCDPYLRHCLLLCWCCNYISDLLSLRQLVAFINFRFHSFFLQQFFRLGCVWAITFRYDEDFLIFDIVHNNVLNLKIVSLGVVDLKLLLHHHLIHLLLFIGTGVGHVLYLRFRDFFAHSEFHGRWLWFRLFSRLCETCRRDTIHDTYSVWWIELLLTTASHLLDLFCLSNTHLLILRLALTSRLLTTFPLHILLATWEHIMCLSYSIWLTRLRSSFRHAVYHKATRLHY